MNVSIKKNASELGSAAGTKAAKIIKEAIDEKGNAAIILATGSSQFETLTTLIKDKEIAWSKVTMFHLDEYIGLPITHNASFRKYLMERFISKVSPLKAVHLINGENNPQDECSRLSKLITSQSIDVALVGIGENGHLAFNDPPADFKTEASYIIANLDHTCRQQQVNEGWFDGIDEVPKQAISMSIHQVMLSQHIICSVPDKRKAAAVRNSLESPISNIYPASILQKHPDCYFYLEEESASLLAKEY